MKTGVLMEPPCVKKMSVENGTGFILKTVNPFDYIKKRNRLERPADIVTSFKEKLRLEETLESEKLSKLFSMKKSIEFEKFFFDAFHPVKNSETFLSEPFEEQKASSRLMSPVVCTKILEWSLQNENSAMFIESVILALLSSGHVSLYTNSGLVIDKIVSLKSASLLLSLLNGYTDLSDSGLTKLILFLNNDDGVSSSAFTKFQDRSEFKFNDSVSVHQTIFMALLAIPKSAQLIKKHFLLVKEAEIISLLNRLLDAYSIIQLAPFKLSSKSLLKCPSAHQIIDWISIVIDSQYPLCLLQPNMLKCIEHANQLISQEISLNYSLMEILPSIKSARCPSTHSNAQTGSIKICASYSVEPSTL